MTAPRRGNPTPGVTRAGTGWKFVVDLPRDAAGRRRQKAVQGYATRRAAVAARDAFLADLATQANAPPAARIQLATFLRDWLDGRPEHDITPATRYAYRKAIEQRIIPGLGDVALGDLTPAMIRRWSVALARSHSATTAQTTHVLLAGALNDAVEWGYLDTNPGRAARRPKRAPSPARALTVDEAQTLLDACPDDQYRAVIHLALLTGFRLGELLALGWRDIDLDAGRIEVGRTQSVDARGKRIVRDDAKTQAGRRAIDASAEAVDVLRRQHDRLAFMRARAGVVWEDQDLVFTNQRGRLLAAETVRNHLRAAARSAGLAPPPLRFHDLRHTAASNLLRAGVDVAVVSRMLGHASPDITYRIYQHVLPGETRAGADVAGRLFGAR